MARVTIHDHDLLARPLRSVASGLREHRLPAVCVRCGEPATSWFRKDFEGLPLRMLLMAPIALGHLSASRRRWTLDLPVCDRHPNPWRDIGRFRWIFFGVFMGGLAGIASLSYVMKALAGIENEWSKKFVALLVCSWLIAVFGLMVAFVAFAFLSIRAGWVTATSITLIRVHRRFADALDRQRRGEQPIEVDEEPDPPDRSDLPDRPPDDRIRR